MVVFFLFVLQAKPTIETDLTDFRKSIR